MITELNVIADEDGEYRGSSANFSGEGFAGMHFIAKASSQGDYEAWLRSARESSLMLDQTTYGDLAKPSISNPPALYQLGEESLFDHIAMKFMPPHTHSAGMPSKGN
jgi:cytochrome o ubiquinol oxidase subunit 2